MLTNNLFTPPFSIHYCSRYESEELKFGNVPSTIKENKHKNNNVLYIHTNDLHDYNIVWIWTIENDVVIFHGYISRELVSILSIPDLFNRLYDEDKYFFTSIVNSNFASNYKEVYERKNIPLLK